MKSLLPKAAAALGIAMLAIGVSATPSMATTSKHVVNCSTWQRVGNSPVYTHTCIDTMLFINGVDPRERYTGMYGYIEVKNTSRTAAKVTATSTMTKVVGKNKPVNMRTFTKKATLATPGRVVVLKDPDTPWYSHLDRVGQKAVNTGTITVTASRTGTDRRSQVTSFTL